MEGVTDPQRSLSQPEVKGQGKEPVWSTQLSPDSACSEGSGGSLEQQQDAGKQAPHTSTCPVCVVSVAFQSLSGRSLSLSFSAADTDSLSQGSSVGSLVLEDDEDRNSLRNHFDTLASSLSDGNKHLITSH